MNYNIIPSNHFYKKISSSPLHIIWTDSNWQVTMKKLQSLLWIAIIWSGFHVLIEVVWVQLRVLKRLNVFQSTFITLTYTLFLYGAQLIYWFADFTGRHWYITDISIGIFVLWCAPVLKFSFMPGRNGWTDDLHWYTLIVFYIYIHTHTQDIGIISEFSCFQTSKNRPLVFPLLNLKSASTLT